MEGTILDEICVADPLKCNKCDFVKEEESDVESFIEVEDEFNPGEEEIHQKCGKKFLDCKCSFVKTFKVIFHGRVRYGTCTCHPCNYDHCECSYNDFYDPDGLSLD